MVLSQSESPYSAHEFDASYPGYLYRGIICNDGNSDLHSGIPQINGSLFARGHLVATQTENATGIFEIDNTTLFIERLSQITDMQQKIETLLITMFLEIGPHALHSLRVAALAYDIATSYGISGEPLRKLFIECLLHDAGKLLMSRSVLWNAGELTPEERESIEKHATDGHLVLQGAGLGQYANTALTHHCYYDQTGYPPNPDTECTASTWIAQIADCLDAAMGVYRGYTDTREFDTVSKIMRNLFGNKFHPDYLNAYNSMLATAFYSSLAAGTDPVMAVARLQERALRLCAENNFLSSEVIAILGSNLTYTDGAPEWAQAALSNSKRL